MYTCEIRQHILSCVGPFISTYSKCSLQILLEYYLIDFVLLELVCLTNILVCVLFLFIGLLLSFCPLFRSSLTATGIVQTALVGFVGIWSVRKRLQALWLDHNAHNVNINVIPLPPCFYFCTLVLCSW